MKETLAPALAATLALESLWGAAQLSPHWEGQECALKVFSFLYIPPAGAASSVTHRMLLPSACVTSGPFGPMDLITFGE